MIGIKVADGSFYPVLEDGFVGTRKLTLTTVRDLQGKVQIDLYQSAEETIENAQFIGSLVLDDIAPAPQGSPEIELSLGIDHEGSLSAVASDLSTGQHQTLNAKLGELPQEEAFEAAPELAATEELTPTVEVEEQPLTGETYPIGEADRRKEHLERRRHHPLAIAGFVVGGLVILALIVFLAYLLFVRSEVFVPGTQPEGQASAGTEEAASPAEAPAVKTAEASEKAAPSQSGTGQQAEAVAKPSSATASTAQAGLTYLIKRGDTLWDISSTFYRNPWLYPKLAKANKIKNPDLIFAGNTIFIPED